uniref:ANK_REP_REGION domain-containing protein n=1 Tax=Echinostoma caproni TaxID=27848 RepID=A0A183AP82_9TREM
LNFLDTSFHPPRSLTAELCLVLGAKGYEAIKLLRQYGAPDESSYFEQLELEQTAFDQCPFVQAVQKAKSAADLDQASKLLKYPSFEIHRLRSSDGATYLHFLVHLYLQKYGKPQFQRALIRLMYQVTLSGVDIQARDCLGRTALVVAAYTEAITESTEDEEDDEHLYLVVKDGNEVPENTPVPLASSRKHSAYGSEHSFHRDNSRDPDEPNYPRLPEENNTESLSIIRDRNTDRMDKEDEKTLDQFLSQRGSIMMFMEEQEQLKKIRQSIQLIQLHKDMENAVQRVRKKKINRERAFCGIPVPDQNLIAVLIQLGVDSTICDQFNRVVQFEPYIPRDALVLKTKQPIFGCTEETKGVQSLPGLWPALDEVLRTMSCSLLSLDVDAEEKRLSEVIAANLVNIRAKRSELSSFELIKALSISPSFCGAISNSVTMSSSKIERTVPSKPQNPNEEISRRLMTLLWSHVGLTDFAMAAMCGDVDQMKLCLAMGNATSKVQACFRRHFHDISSDGRVIYVCRPLLVHVMDYSTADAVELMLNYGADLSEFYHGKYPKPQKDSNVLFRWQILIYV